MSCSVGFCWQQLTAAVGNNTDESESKQVAVKPKQWAESVCRVKGNPCKILIRAALTNDSIFRWNVLWTVLTPQQSEWDIALCFHTISHMDYRYFIVAIQYRVFSGVKINIIVWSYITDSKCGFKLIELCYSLNLFITAPKTAKPYRHLVDSFPPQRKLSSRSTVREQEFCTSSLPLAARFYNCGCGYCCF